MHINRWTKIGLMGSVVSLLIGGGLLALTSDSATSEDNTITSGSFSSAHQLQMAHAGSYESGDGVVTPTCDEVDASGGRETFTPPVYGEGPIGAVIPSGFLSGVQTAGDGEDLCVKNAGGTTADIIHLKVTRLLDREVLPPRSLDGCTQAERNAGDTSCVGTDSAGELAQFVTLAPFGCNAAWSTETLPTLAGTGVTGISFLAPGASCLLSLDYGVTDAVADDPSSALIAETDRVDFDITVQLLTLDD